MGDPGNDGVDAEWWNSDGEQLTLFSNFTPLVLSTMSKYSEGSDYIVSVCCGSIFFGSLKLYKGPK